MQKNGRHTAERTAEDKGFYIILILCVAAIAISGYVLFFAPLVNDASMDSVEYQPNITEDTSWKPTAGEMTEPVIDTTLPVEEEPTKSEPQGIPEEPAEQTAAPQPVWVKPVNGEVVQAFSGDNLVYHKTFGDWRVHAGSDYQAPSGTRVYAVFDGEVTEVVNDPLWGASVTLKLSDGRTAIYRGLEEKTKVKQGSKVKAGDVLGSIASVLPAETEQGAHLHLEMKDQDGVSIDPEKAAE